VFAHELGHNLGMHHASTPTSEYGDTSDIMGYSGFGLRQLNAPHQEQMGWRAAEKIFAVTESGLYDIAPLEIEDQQALAPQALKIAKPDTDEYYYLSYRKKIGFDNNLPSQYPDRLNVHCYKGDGSASRTYFLDALEDGQSFVDAVNGVTITQVGHTDDSVTVQVQLDATCVTAAPVVGISPIIRSAAPGTSVDYTVTVSNADSANCSASTFSLDAVLPDGWTGTILPETIDIPAGQSGAATLSVISPGAAAEASYGFPVNVSDGTEPLHSASATAGYVVEGIDEADAEAPTVPGDLSAGLKGKNVKLTWNAATDNVGVSGYAVWRNGVRIDDTIETAFVDSAVPSGTTYTYTVSAYDAAGNMSSISHPAIVTISKKTNPGKGKPK
jgi:hypothetical protein